MALPPTCIYDYIKKDHNDTFNSLKRAGLLNKKAIKNKDEFLQNLTIYYWRVAASDTNSASTTSSSRYFLYMGNPDLTPPANVSSFNQAGTGLHEIGLTWSNPGDDDYYGALIVRSAVAITWVPEDDSEYLAGQEVSAGVYVVGTVIGNHSSNPYINYS